jgi:hypothetical protein
MRNESYLINLFFERPNRFILLSYFMEQGGCFLYLFFLGRKVGPCKKWLFLVLSNDDNDTQIILVQKL